MEISITDCIVSMVQWYAVLTELGEVYLKWFVLHRSKRVELVKGVLSADIRSGGVQNHFWYVPHFITISYAFNDVPYLRGTGQFNHRWSLRLLSLPIIIVVIVVEIKWLQFRILSGDDCICSCGLQDEYHVLCPEVVVSVSEFRDIVALILGKVGSEDVIGRLWRWLVMVFSSSAVYAPVTTVARFRVLQALFGGCEQDCDNLDSSDNRAYNLLKCTHC